ncbi:Pycsar system effector family protein [Streptomyces marokkonensis]|uniref:Pycsar system effector family protein n=1 Tax=Streptomyces marokkonensis TaxID=324855 RepID=A0ABW6Q3F2_9ACTN|nr:Pycsar system effector family protein [Streptomyces marokkonensis]
MTATGPVPAPTTTADTPDPARAPTRAPSPPTAARAQLCERLLADLRTEIARADSKAAVLVAALGITAGVFSGLLAGRNWSPDTLSAAGAAVWWAGTSALALSLFALLLAVLPRYRSGTWVQGQPLSYFGDIQRAVRAGRLDTALADTEADPVAGLTAALTETSRIAWRKHQWIRTGLIAFCTGTLLLPASLLIG